MGITVDRGCIARSQEHLLQRLDDELDGGVDREPDHAFARVQISAKHGTIESARTEEGVETVGATGLVKKTLSVGRSRRDRKEEGARVCEARQKSLSNTARSVLTKTAANANGDAHPIVYGRRATRSSTPDQNSFLEDRMRISIGLTAEVERSEGRGDPRILQARVQEPVDEPSSQMVHRIRQTRSRGRT